MDKLSGFVALAALVLGASASDGLANEVGRLNNETLFWGPYKPNLYFGVRPRMPGGLWTGLMWGNVDRFEDVQHGFRYTCEQGEIEGYGWEEYDSRTGGVQKFYDEKNKIDISTTFVKLPGGTHGGSWAARIKGELRDDAPSDAKTMLYYYVAQEGDGVLTPTTTGTEFGYDGDVKLTGQTKLLGDFSVLVTKGKGRHPVSDHDISSLRHGDTTILKTVNAETEHRWQGKAIVYMQLQEAINYIKSNIDVNSPPPPWQVYRLSHEPGTGNVQIVQKTFEGAFEFDVIFSSGSADEELTTENLTAEIGKVSKGFAQRFRETFELKAPYNAEKYQPFAKSMLSNLLGGVGYFHGEQLVDRSFAPEYEELNEGFWEEAAEARNRKQQKLEGPYELFTSVPSRPFFPRGFLWDEGYHLLQIADWDIDLTLEIIKSWYDTMDEDGWIPREQILGEEARSKVPEEFQVQYPHIANPPTLYLVIESFTKKLFDAKKNKAGAETTKPSAETIRMAHLDNPELGEEYLRKLYPLLRRQYDWFRKTQRGEVTSYDREAFSSKEAYRWRGRTESHVLASGLDDYPRPQPPHPSELHVDLMSWIGLMTKSLINIAGPLGFDDDVKELTKNLDAIERNLVDLHWSEKEGCFCDADVDDFEEHELVCHKGYVSLSPFLVGLMKPDDPKLGRILDLIGDESELFSPFGIRSLSARDPEFGTKENYWRGPVWMPMNYMAVTQLHNTATQEGPYQERAKKLYRQLRHNLVDTVYKSWKETGFAWEQYNPDTGAGQRTQHFTGWTSLVVKIMAMGDLDDEDHVKDEL